MVGKVVAAWIWLAPFDTTNSLVACLDRGDFPDT